MKGEIYHGLLGFKDYANVNIAKFSVAGLRAIDFLLRQFYHF